MTARIRSWFAPLLCCTLLAGCESLFDAGFQPQPLTRGAETERALRVGNAPSWIAGDPAVRRLTPLVRQDPEAHLQQLVDALVADRADGFEKVRAIHDWVTRNIAYDFPAYLGKSPMVVEPYAVIRRGSSVCDGYAHVFALMCTMAGIQSEVVVGYGRGYGFDPYSEDAQPYQSNHAWNAVLVNGGWYLVDTTWDAGGVSGEGNTFTFKWQSSTGFLFTPPEVFLCTHFPDDPRWQLLDKPLGLAQLRSQPALWGDFGTLGVSSGTTLQRVAAAGEEQVITLRVPSSLTLYPFISPDSAAGGGSGYLIGQKQDGDQVTVRVMFPVAGRYGLLLTALKDRDQTRPVVLGELFFVSTGGSQKRSALLYPGAHESGLTLDGVDGYAYRVGGTTSFSYSYDGDVMVSLEDKARRMFQNRVRVVREGNRQVATVSFPAPGEYTVTLAARSRTDRTRWVGIASLTYESAAAGGLEYPEISGAGQRMGVVFEGEPGYNPNVPGETQFSMRIHAPVIVSLMDGSNKPVEGHTFMSTDGDRTTVRVSFPGPGSYTAWVSAPAGEGSRTWEGVASLHFVASAAGRIFPTIYASGRPGFQVVAPLDGRLTAGQDAQFEVLGPPGASIFVHTNDTSVRLTGTAGRYEGTVHLQAGRLLVFGELKAGQSQAIAEYQVR